VLVSPCDSVALERVEAVDCCDEREGQTHSWEAPTDGTACPAIAQRLGPRPIDGLKGAASQRRSPRTGPGRPGRLLRFGSRKRPQWEYSRTRAGPAARSLGPSPEATDGACCATRREAWVTGFDCGAVPYFYGRYPAPWWTRPDLIDGAEVLALFLPRGSNRGTRRLG
jgi:hypothetical protein